ncbi:MAG: excalibur calcium-binding domain-containing protein [Stenotrophomonas sp.]
MAACGPAAAHSGGLNKDGCHTNRSTGDYHCHRGAGAPASSRPTRPSQQSFSPTTLAPARSSAGTRAFANCAEARAAGAAPVRRGDPGYGPHLDRDNDGIGCEPYRGRR